MKLSKLIDPQFQVILRKIAGQDIPLRTAFKLKGIIKCVNDELVKYDEVRGEALKRLGDKKEDGSLDVDESGTVKLSEDNMKDFAAELTTLINTDIDVGTLKIDELGDKLSLTAAELMTLDDLIVS